jgi:hypothetical protein
MESCFYCFFTLLYNFLISISGKFTILFVLILVFSLFFRNWHSLSNRQTLSYWNQQAFFLWSHCLIKKQKISVSLLMIIFLKYCLQIISPIRLYIIKCYNPNLFAKLILKFQFKQIILILYYLRILKLFENIYSIIEENT